MSFELEVWSKTEDVVQTLLQVGVPSVVLSHMKAVTMTYGLCSHLLNLLALQGVPFGEPWRPDCNGKPIVP